VNFSSAKERTVAVTSFNDLKTLIDSILSQNGQTADVKDAPHGAFWNNLTYQKFVQGNVPGVNPAVPILVAGNSAQSNIILALRGTGPLFDPNTGTFGQMPADGPPFFTQANIDDIAAWIDAGCPE
jgi:hypothetical protein